MIRKEKMWMRRTRYISYKRGGKRESAFSAQRMRTFFNHLQCLPTQRSSLRWHFVWLVLAEWAREQEIEREREQESEWSVGWWSLFEAYRFRQLAPLIKAYETLQINESNETQCEPGVTLMRAAIKHGRRVSLGKWGALYTTSKHRWLSFSSRSLQRRNTV